MRNISKSLHQTTYGSERWVPSEFYIGSPFRDAFVWDDLGIQSAFGNYTSTTYAASIQISAEAIKDMSRASVISWNPSAK